MLGRFPRPGTRVGAAGQPAWHLQEDTEGRRTGLGAEWPCHGSCPPLQDTRLSLGRPEMTGSCGHHRPIHCPLYQEVASLADGSGHSVSAPPTSPALAQTCPDHSEGTPGARAGSHTSWSPDPETEVSFRSAGGPRGSWACGHVTSAATMWLQALPAWPCKGQRCPAEIATTPARSGAWPDSRATTADEASPQSGRMAGPCSVR